MASMFLQYAAVSDSGRDAARISLASLLALLLVGVTALAGAPLAAQAPPGFGQQVVEPSESAATESAIPDVPLERISPRATFRTFLQGLAERDWPAVIGTLDLETGGLTRDAVEIRGRELATQLKTVLDRVALVEYPEIPVELGGETRWVWREVEGIPIALERTAQGWQFSRRTLDNLPELLEAVAGRTVVEGVTESPTSFALWLQERLPRGLRGGFLLPYWQWLALALLAFLGILADRLVVFALERSVARRLALGLQAAAVDDRLIRTAIRPLGLVAMAALWWLALLVLGLPARALTVLLVAVKFIAIASVVWAAYKAVDIVAALLAMRAQRTSTRYDDLLVPLVRKSAKVFIAAFGVVFLADNLDINITSLLAGLGLGGIAVALAAQDTVKNLFGSVTVLVDRPFQVGDWVVIGDVEGTVEEVGFRSTRIRTFYNSLVTLPNSNLISASVDNLGARSYRRWRSTLGVAYDTPPEKVDALCEGIRELVRRHPYTRKDYFQVYLNEFGAHSLDILLYVFFDTPDWGTELRERHRLAVDILRLTHRLGIEIAFPTQTLWLRRGEPVEAEELDPEYGERAREEERRARREARQLLHSSLGGAVPPPVPAEPAAPEEDEDPARPRGGEAG